jgi:DNA-binding transcriptional LysR family regulator
MRYVVADELERIERRLKLHEMRVLMATVEAGSMGKAARRLHTSQPAISRTISDLEHALGVPLLDRSPQGIEPTEYGRALIRRGLAVFDELKQGIKDIEFLADPAAGELRIGCNPFLAASFVPAVVDRLSRRFPRIVFHLVTTYGETLHRELSERNVDLLITRQFDPIAGERRGFEFLFDEPYVVAAGAQSPWARRRRIKLAELVNESWTLPPPRSVMATVVVEIFRASKLDYPRTTVFTDSAEARMSLLATGRFLAILQASALRGSTRQPAIKVLPVDPPMAVTRIGVVTLKNRTLSPVAKLFIDCAREVAKPLAKVKAKTGSGHGAF